MEPANGCRICMRILSGSGKTPWVWSTEGSLALQLAEPSGVTSTSYNRPAERKTGDSDWIDTHPGVRGSRLHIGLRRRRTIASIRPGPNLRKGAFYEGENCGGLHHCSIPWMCFEPALARFNAARRPRFVAFGNN